MKTTSTIAAFSGLLSAASAQYFGALALRSGSDLQYLSLQARNESIFVGGSPATYCPETVVGACPPGNTTTFIGGNGGLSLGTEVPGGQQVYIDGCTGAVEYTQAHSAATPEGAILDGWNITLTSPYGELTWTNGLVACPETVDDATNYKVYALVDGVSVADDCLGFDAVTVNVTEASAWQYE